MEKVILLSTTCSTIQNTVGKYMLTGHRGGNALTSRCPLKRNMYFYIQTNADVHDHQALLKGQG